MSTALAPRLLLVTTSSFTVRPSSITQFRKIFATVRPTIGGARSRFNTPLYSTSRTMASDAAPVEMRLKNASILVCDMQEKFRNAIYEFDSIVTTQKKLLTFANALSVPIHATTQTSAKLGPIIPSLADLLPPSHAIVDKTRFSMAIPALLDRLGAARPAHVALTGIESHICITQTALDLRDRGFKVYVLADAVSSCNRGEVVVALDRLRAEEGVTVTTSESWMYECLGDASHADFKALFNVVKGSAADTKKVMETLPPGPRM